MDCATVDLPAGLEDSYKGVDYLEIDLITTLP
jgi:hypothetical protein